MRIQDLASWPPQLTDSHTFRVANSQKLPATLRRCGVYTIAGSAEPYLSLVFDYQGRSWHAMLHDMPQILMHRVAATLQGQEGKELQELGSLTIVEGESP